MISPTSTRALSLYHLLDPAVRANPYPLYAALRSEDPVHWDPYLHTWIVTRYADVVHVLRDYSAQRTPSPEQLTAIGLASLGPIAHVLVRQMLFLDAPAHTRLRSLASRAFTPRRIERLRGHITEIVTTLVDAVQPSGRMDVIGDLASPLPAIVTAGMLGVPVSDWRQLKEWSTQFAEVLGNLQHNPDRAIRILASLEEMTAYFRTAIADARRLGHDTLIHALATAEDNGDRLTEDEVVANCIVTMVGGQETTTNLIGNGMLALLRHPDQLTKLRAHPELMPSAVEELLRYDCPSQHTARLAPADVELGGRSIRARQAVIAVMAAANRDPERFADPDRLDIERTDNRHVAFGWAAHFCFGAPLARMEGQIALRALLTRFPHLRLASESLVWRENLGLRGLEALPVAFAPATDAECTAAVAWS